ncbi:Sodium/hydrogen exchanger family-domain-containing protein [Podospora didyma]|uniref:Sodium/hydrogen exchanger family-domain-containing protein n=1 Tax=Podospora didyma TaxID=330526 RepID=A0AAE0NQL0_9PEZI|nr:Sodium/hydrogen exchanger family-domain-containing protein [Podospora didyma]
MSTTTAAIIIATTASKVATASATAAVKPPSQAGIFEGLNPTVYNASDPIILFIIQATLVIALTRLLYWPLSKIREPRVIAEVITGIILGPSVMGRIPGFTAAIFPPAGMAPFRLAANLGLVLFLFLVGLEINLTYLLRNWRIAISVASLDMAIPFGLGVAVAYGLYNEFAGEPGTAPISFGLFALFIGVAMAITAFPVLCRILTSLKLLNTTVGVIVLTSGIANDVVGWVLLALCVTLVNAGAGVTAVWVLLVAVGYSFFLAYAVRPAFMWVLRRTRSLENGPTEGVVALTIFMVLASAFFTSVIGVHSIFGAFMIGLMCPHEGGFAIKLTEKIEDLTSTLFVPLFFALSGINTNLALLDSGKVWGYVIAITVVAFFSKVIGGSLGARLNGLVWRESLTIGTLMSCKGLVELIVLNIGLQANILLPRTFTMFVVMALVTTFATAPLVSWLYPPWYQQKLDLWKKGKIDWEGNPILPPDGRDAEDEYRKGDAATRLLVYLRTDGLSSTLSILSLFTTGKSAAQHAPRSSSEEPRGEKAPAAPQAPNSDEQRPLHVHGCRLVELTERNSSVMKVSDIEGHAGQDPIVKAFGTSTANNTTRDVFVSGQIAVVPEESFADTLATQASKGNSDLILVPWSETGTVSELPSSFFFTGSTPKRGDLLENRDFAGLVGQIFDKARHIAGVGVFVEKSLLEAGSGEPAPASGITRQLTRDATGISLAESHDANAVKFHSADSRGRKLIRTLYNAARGGEDDLYAARLAFQLAQSDRVVLEVVVDESSAKNTSSDFEVLKSVVSGTLGDRVTFTQVTSSDTVVQTLLAPTEETGTVLVILGRGSSSSASDQQQSSEEGPSSAATTIGSISKVLGPTTARVAAGIRKGAANSKPKASLLVVQARTAPAPAGGEHALQRKASTYSHESADN